MAPNSNYIILCLIARIGILHAQNPQLNQTLTNELDFGYGLQKYSKAECDSFPKSVFSYNKLSNNILHANKISFKTLFSKDNKGTIYQSSISEIKIISYEYVGNSKKSYLMLNKKRFYYENVMNKSYKEQNFHLISAYTFSIRNKSYLSIAVTYMAGNNSNNIIKPMLFEIHQNTFTQVVIPGFVRTDSPLCFGDFDNDGNIDYAAWNPNNQSKLKLFTLSNHLLKLNNKYYLTLLNNIDGYLFSIDSSKSYWTNSNGGLYNSICK